jgi:hypothetical protein
METQSKNNEKQLFVAGLQGAGKTSFLAAFYHVVESGEVQGSLRLKQLKGDLSYLNLIRGLWVDAQDLERTHLSDQGNLLMLLEDSACKSCELWIPDLSGEGFETQWTDRVASKEYCSYVERSAGGMLFIHPHVKESHLITEINAILPPADNKEANGTKQPIVKWDPALAPTQVQLVEIMQFVSTIRSQKPFKLAVIVSAWDLVLSIEPNQDPETWVQKHLPLLRQHLSNNAKSIQCKFYGISAQGGNFETDERRTALREENLPSNRISVSDGVGLTHDITEPVKWLI